MVTGIVTSSDGEIFLSNKNHQRTANQVAFQTLPYALVVASPATIIVLQNQCTSVISLMGFRLSFSNLKAHINYNWF
jgi:hypothetical protein